ncbi:hypothetical protein Barb4_00401 [Bacteroidales bacterium Barb4]|nr:hypothetical protein Barb4_00401 [Bacteroidales bacterium Barb4]
MIHTEGIHTFRHLLFLFFNFFFDGQAKCAQPPLQHEGHELSFFSPSPLITAKGKKDRQDANGDVKTLR